MSFLTDVATEMTYPLLPVFLATVLGASATYVGTIEGAAETTAALLKLASGWWSDRVARRKPLVLAGYALASAVRPLIGLAQSAVQVLGIRRRRPGRQGDPHLAPRRPDRRLGRPRHPRPGLRLPPRRRQRWAPCWGRSSPSPSCAGRGSPLRTVFLLTAIPGALAVLTLIFGVREVPRTAPPKQEGGVDLKAPLGGRFWAYLGVLLLFTLGNSTDAFLLLRASQLGVATGPDPDPLGPAQPGQGGLQHPRRHPLGPHRPQAAHRRRLAGLRGRLLRSSAAPAQTWQAWALFAVYGVYFGLTEGVEKALVADLVPEDRRGAAFGWYNLAIGIGALPASLLFGALWDRWGSADRLRLRRPARPGGGGGGDLRGAPARRRLIAVEFGLSERIDR